MNLLAANATGNVTGSWLAFRGVFNGNNKAWFIVLGAHGGATYDLYWRPTGTADATKHLVAKYTNIATDLMKEVALPAGELQVVVSGGTSVNAMPKIVF